MSNGVPFDPVYAASDLPTFGDAPSEELFVYLKDGSLNGRALDLGCGDGRDSLPLAHLGFRVTAIDLSETGLNKLRRFARERGLGGRVCAVCCDIRLWEYPAEHFDLVVAVTSLDHVASEDLPSLFTRIVRSLRHGGVLFAKVHTVDDPGYGVTHGPISELSRMIKHYFARGELMQLAQSEMEIIRYEEHQEVDEDHGPRHSHGFATMIAVRR